MKESYENRAITSSSKRAASKPKKEVKKKVKTIQFLISPTGKYNLAYNAGEIVKTDYIKKELLDKMIKEGDAKLCD